MSLFCLSPVSCCWLDAEHHRKFVQQAAVNGEMTVLWVKVAEGELTGGNFQFIGNTDLARKPPECLEYLVVHELAHMLEPTHNTRFIALMDRHMPQWRSHQESLNRLPVRHEHWSY